MKRRVLVVAALSFALGATAVGMLLMSEPVLQWLFPRIAALAGGGLHIERLRGRLLGPIVIEGLEYRTQQVTVRVEHLTFTWQPTWLLGATLRITDVRADNATVDLAADGPAAGNAVAPARLPLRIVLHNADVRNLTIAGGAGRAGTRIDRLQTSLSIRGEHVSIDDLRADAGASHADVRGRLGAVPALI